MNSPRKSYISIVAIILAGLGVILTAILLYSSRQLQELQNQAAYPTPEEGTYELIARTYSGVSKIQIVHADKEIFDNLWFVESHIWAENRSDGKGFSDQDYDNPGWFFLRLPNGWVFVPEGKFPEIVAFGQWLFRF